MRLAGNLTLLYGHLPESERFAAARRDGFVGVEILFPYAEPPAWYAAQLRAHGLELVLINTPVSEGVGRAGLTALPNKEREFHAAFERATAVANVCGCRSIHVMAGIVPPDVTPSESRATLLENLRWASAQAAAAGVVLTLEALNRLDFPGYAYHQPHEVLAIVRELDSPFVRVQFDLYHTAKERLSVRAELERALPLVHHIQIAGTPDRHEPDLGKDGLLSCFELLVEQGYDRWVGCEYRPRATAVDFAWATPLVQKKAVRF